MTLQLVDSGLLSLFKIMYAAPGCAMGVVGGILR